MNIVEYPKQSEEYYSTVFTEPEENKCFSKIAEMIIRTTVFSRQRHFENKCFSIIMFRRRAWGHSRKLV